MKTEKEKVQNVSQLIKVRNKKISYLDNMLNFRVKGPFALGCTDVNFLSFLSEMGCLVTVHT